MLFQTIILIIAKLKKNIFWILKEKQSETKWIKFSCLSNQNFEKLEWNGHSQIKLYNWYYDCQEFPIYVYSVSDDIFIIILLLLLYM